MMKTWTEDQLVAAVENSQTLAQVIKKLGLVVAGGNYKTIQKAINDLELDTSHFTGQSWSNGKLRPQGIRGKSLEDWLINGSTIGSYKLKKRLIREGYFEEVCSKCKLSTWNEQPIPLELEHINGVHNDNRLSNLCLLCPNCHAQTDTYRGKNQKRRASVVER